MLSRPHTSSTEPTKKLLLLTSEFPPGPGGIGTHAFQLADKLTAFGWRVTVAGPQAYVSIDEAKAFNAGLPFDVVRARRLSPAAAEGAYRLGSAIRAGMRQQPDLIVGTGLKAAWLSPLVSKALGVPWVAVGHALEFSLRRRWQRAVSRSAYSNASGVICVSSYTWSKMTALGVQPPRGEVIHNGADVDVYQPAAAGTVARVTEATVGARAPLVVTVGSVTARKGQEVVVKALPALLRQVPDAHYVAIGRPYERDRVRALAASLGVADRVHLLGARPTEEVVAWLTRADVFAMTSQHTSDGDFEGFGIAVIEAALCGTPAVVSNASGVAESIDDGKTGIAVPESDPETTAAALASLLGDSLGLERMSRAAQKRAQESYSWRDRIGEYDRFFRDLLRDSRCG